MRNLVRWQGSTIVGLVGAVAAFIFMRWYLVYGDCKEPVVESQRACINRHLDDSFLTFELPGLVAILGFLLGFFLIYFLSLVGDRGKPGKHAGKPEKDM